MIYLTYFGAPIALVVGLLVALVTDPLVRWRIRVRRPAERRGIELMRSWLTPEQAEQWNTRGNIEVVGCNTGRRYRITRGTAMNIHELDANGRTVAEWCFARQTRNG
jgi:hypothetical protein